MPDHPRNENDTSSFDDWLAEDSAPPTDPVAVPSASSDDDQDATSEIESDDVAEDSGSHADDDQDITGEGPEAGAPSDDDMGIEDVEGDAMFRPHDPDVEPVTEGSADAEVPEPDDLVDTGELEITTPPAGFSAGFELDDVDDPPADGFVAPLEDEVLEFEAPVVEFEDFDGGVDVATEVERAEPVDPPAFEVDTGEIELGAAEPFTGFDVGDSEVVGYDDFVVQNDSDALSASEDDGVAEVDFGSWGDQTDESVAVETFEGAVPYDFPQDTSDTAFDPFEDTGEAVFIGGTESPPSELVGGSSFSALWAEGPADDPPSSDAQTDEDTGEDFDLADNELILGATREHVGLAAAIARAETEDTAQVALVAEIPGLESSVVGFEDVVQAEGYRRVRAKAAGDLIARVVTGAILILALGASLIWRPALVVLVISVFVLGAGEFYTALVRSERKPISLFGFLGIIGASLGAFWWSAAAIPIAFILATVMLLLFYAVVPGKVDPMGNLALTMTVMVWAGLGSFALAISRSDDYQILILGVVATVAAADIAAFFVGRAVGRTHLAPWVSPNKTVEGLVAGSIFAIGIGAGLHYFPPFELTSGLAIGASAAVLTPLGDLAMSAAKRSLGLKNMGSVLPGHGGFLDRIDGLLFAVPAAWAIFIWAGLL